jgi:DNA-directed RNA polymerase specialized sigma24 family protein
METQKTTIKIDGIEIEITGEMKRSWYKMINDTRNEARKNGTCGQTSYWRCDGDCAICPWHFSGIFVSYEETFMTDEPDHSVAYGEHLAADTEPGPAEIAEYSDTIERMLAQARLICEDGDQILTMCMAKRTSYEIGNRLGIPQKTAHRRIRKLQNELREYYCKNFE